MTVEIRADGEADAATAHEARLLAVVELALGAGVGGGLEGEVAPGIYVCDSAAFPDLPAVSLTFTIMAQAHRLAAQSL